MRQSQLFTKARREDPKDEQSKNAKLLIRAGFIHKELAGVYSYLPLGLRTIKKIENIIREEINAVGGVELSMTAFQNPELWKKTGRWDDEVLDVWFKTELKAGGEIGLGTTHEEMITNIMRDHINSYKDLPLSVYQFQTKFRNELRAKSGIMRGREFLMKDLYSFHTNEESLADYYDKVKGAYERIYERCGLGDITYITFSSGGTFSKYSHEYQTISEAGEDKIFINREKKIAINEEVLNDETLSDLGLKRDDLEEAKAIEVGNIFKLGTKFSEPLELFYTDENGEKKPVVMGCYGIGLGRVMGTVAEALADDKGLVWPKEISPFKLSFVCLAKKDTEVFKQAEEVYQKLVASGVEVLFDDREVSAGEKMAEADLFGFPYRVVISEKTLALNQLELKERASGEVRMVDLSELMEIVK